MKHVRFTIVLVTAIIITFLFGYAFNVERAEANIPWVLPPAIAYGLDVLPAHTRVKKQIEDERHEKLLAGIEKEKEERHYESKPKICLSLYDNAYSIRQLSYFYDAEGNIDKDRLWDYVCSISDEFDTYNTIRNFVNVYGETMQVGGSQYLSDTYGYLLDKEWTYDRLYEALERGEPCIIDAVWESTAMTRNAENGDIGNTYIEIDTDAQHLWFFVDGELYLDTPIVTGLPTPNRFTPPGLYSIWNKDTDVNLIGSIDGDSWDSFVNYWMSVTWNEIGMHDAPWRGASPENYGGDIYLYNGSHGCINLPYQAEEDIFYTAPIGTPVIIY